MDMNQAAVFMAGSLLFSVGVVILVIAAVIINNVIERYWKPVTIFTRESFTLFGTAHNFNDPMQNLTQEEYDKLSSYLIELRDRPKIEPSFEEDKNQKRT